MVQIAPHSVGPGGAQAHELDRRMPGRERLERVDEIPDALGSQPLSGEQEPTRARRVDPSLPEEIVLDAVRHDSHGQARPSRETMKSRSGNSGRTRDRRASRRGEQARHEPLLEEDELRRQAFARACELGGERLVIERLQTVERDDRCWPGGSAGPSQQGVCPPGDCERPRRRTRADCASETEGESGCSRDHEPNGRSAGVRISTV